MAVLTNADYEKIADVIRSNPDAKIIFKAWNLEKATWKSMLQAAENWFVGAFNITPTTSFKAALDAVATTTAVQARWIGKIWFAWRIGIDW